MTYVHISSSEWKIKCLLTNFLNRKRVRLDLEAKQTLICSSDSEVERSGLPGLRELSVFQQVIKVELPYFSAQKGMGCEHVWLLRTFVQHLLHFTKSHVLTALFPVPIIESLSVVLKPWSHPRSLLQNTACPEDLSSLSAQLTWKQR